jgi:hypothetical protein
MTPRSTLPGFPGLPADPIAFLANPSVSMSRALARQRRIGGATRLIPRKQTALKTIAKCLLQGVAAYRSLSRRSKPCRFGHLPQIPGGSIRFMETSMTGSTIAGTTIMLEHRLMVRPGLAGIVAGMSFAAAPLAENLTRPDLLPAYGPAPPIALST